MKTIVQLTVLFLFIILSNLTAVANSNELKNYKKKKMELEKKGITFTMRYNQHDEIQPANPK